MQHRTLENGKTINLVAVGMNFNGTNDLTDSNVIEGFKLYRLDGGDQYPIELTSVVIQDGKHELFPGFNCINRQWEGWDSEWRF